MKLRSCLPLLLAGFLLLFASRPVCAQDPISWWRGDGNALDSLGGNNGTLQGGVTYGPGVIGQAFVFDGSNGVVHIPDSANMQITGSISITAWVKVTAWPTNSAHLSYIVFRGDNRLGLDPWFLGVVPQGQLVFAITGDDGSPGGKRVFVGAPVPLNKFVFVAASFDSTTGIMRLSIDGVTLGQLGTDVRPLGNLNPSSNPGMGIGNTQDPGFSNQPFEGVVDDVKVYNTVVGPVPYPYMDAHTIVYQNQASGGILAEQFQAGAFVGAQYITHALDPNWKVVAYADFDGDGQPDLLFQNKKTGAIAVWFLNGTTLKGTKYIAYGMDPKFKIVAVGDFNGDGKPDIVFQNQNSGAVAVWLMAGTVRIGAAYVTLALPAGWNVVGAAELEGGGQADLVLQNTTTQAVAAFLMSGTSLRDRLYLYPSPAMAGQHIGPNFQIAGVMNMNAFGQTALVWQNQTTGVTDVWFMNGFTFALSDYPSGSGDPNWKVVGQQ